MKRTLEYILKAWGLVLRGYSGWIFYRAGRYVRSFFSTTCQINSVSPDWLSQTQIQAAMEEFNRVFQRSHTKALCIHLYYSDVLAEILDQPFVQTEKMDLYISLGMHVDHHFFVKLAPYKGRVRLYQLQNRGRDVYPFLKIFPELLSYDWVCKLHSKRSPQIRDGELWRRDLFFDLLSKETGEKLSSVSQNVNLVASLRSLLPVSLFVGANGPRMRELLNQMNIPSIPEDFLFIAGTMFWFRPQALLPLQQLGDPDTLFEDESPTIDGLTAHAFERLFYFIATQESAL